MEQLYTVILCGMPGGDITSFLHDEKFAQQCYLTSEPIAARRKGASVKVFAVSEIGYDPYTTVLTHRRIVV